MYIHTYSCTGRDRFDPAEEGILSVHRLLVRNYLLCAAGGSAVLAALATYVSVVACTAVCVVWRKRGYVC
jgi:hypothetical protein